MGARAVLFCGGRFVVGWLWREGMGLGCLVWGVWACGLAVLCTDDRNGLELDWVLWWMEGHGSIFLQARFIWEGVLP